MHPDVSRDLGTADFRVLIAENLKSLRILRGLTQAQLAEAAGVDPKTYQRYEYADINIPMSKAFRLAQALGCSLDDLLAPPGLCAAPIPEDLVPLPPPRRLPVPQTRLAQWFGNKVLKPLIRVLARRTKSRGPEK